MHTARLLHCRNSGISGETAARLGGFRGRPAWRRTPAPAAKSRSVNSWRAGVSALAVGAARASTESPCEGHHRRSAPARKREAGGCPRTGRPGRVGARRGHRRRRLRHRRRDRGGQVRLGAAGQDAPGARARIAGPGAGSRPEQRAEEGRPRRRHRPPPRPGAVPQLRGRRVGHVPQRPVHRARHQGDRRLHVRTLADRAGVRDEGRPVARPARGACSSRRRS